MNGLEQRVRHMAIADAERRLADLSTVVETLVERYDALLKASIDAFKRLDASIADVQRSVGQLQATTDRRWLILSDQVCAFEAMTLWQRLQWIVRGRR